MDGVEYRVAGALNRGWRRLLWRGIAALLFGIITWLAPGISLVAMVLLFGSYALVDGILATLLAVSVGNRTYSDNWWALLLTGLIGVGIGIVTVTAPGVTAIALLFYMAVWSIARGVLEIVTAIRLHSEIEGEWLYILGGLVSVAFGAFLMARPAAGVLTKLSLVSAYALAFGVILVLLAFKARGFSERFTMQDRQREPGEGGLAQHRIRTA